jgi:hypothetical protein
VKEVARTTSPGAAKDIASTPGLSHKKEGSYAASAVDPIIDGLLDVVQSTLISYNAAVANAQAWQKKATAAAQQRVELEKVASVDQDLVVSTLDKLEDTGFFSDADIKQARVKMAAFLSESPNNALVLAQRVLQFSTPSLSEGRGIPKSASNRTGDTKVSSKAMGYPDGWLEDGWDTVVREGA